MEMSYCHIDQKEEPIPPEAIVVCFECGHVYESAEALMLEVRRFNDKDALIIVTIEDVMFCPLCLHDFPGSVA